MNQNARMSINISLKFVPTCLFNNIPVLVHIMAWRRPSDKPLSELMMVNLLTHICVTRPQWVKGISLNHIGYMYTNFPFSSKWQAIVWMNGGLIYILTPKRVIEYDHDKLKNIRNISTSSRSHTHNIDAQTCPFCITKTHIKVLQSSPASNPDMPKVTADTKNDVSTIYWIGAPQTLNMRITQHPVKFHQFWTDLVCQRSRLPTISFDNNTGIYDIS